MVLTSEVVHRIGDHADEPFGQVLRPMPGIAHSDGRGQFVDGLRSLYWRQFMKIRLHGIHTLGKVAFEHAAQVLRRGGDADGAVELPPEGVKPVFGHGEELAVAAAELRTAFGRVVAKGVCSRRNSSIRSFRDCLPGAATLSDDLFAIALAENPLNVRGAVANLVTDLNGFQISFAVPMPERRIANAA